MKLKKQCSAACFFLLLVWTISSCGNGNSSGGSGDSKHDTTGTTDSLLKGANTDPNLIDPEAVPEKAGIAVFALWVPKDPGNRTYDGVYDSISSYFKLCENNDAHHIDDRSEVSINPDNKCYNQQMDLRILAIQTPAGPPVFTTVLHVDSVGRNLVCLTANNDTIAISARALKPEAFERLKVNYRVSPFKEQELNKIKKFYAPEMKLQNQIRKKEVLRPMVREN